MADTLVPFSQLGRKFSILAEPEAPTYADLLGQSAGFNIATNPSLAETLPPQVAPSLPEVPPQAIAPKQAPSTAKAGGLDLNEVMNQINKLSKSAETDDGILGLGMNKSQLLMLLLGTVATRGMNPEDAWRTTIGLMNLPTQFQAQKHQAAFNQLRGMVELLKAAKTKQEIEQSQLALKQTQQVLESEGIIEPATQPRTPQVSPLGSTQGSLSEELSLPGEFSQTLSQIRPGTVKPVPAAPRQRTLALEGISLGPGGAQLQLKRREPSLSLDQIVTAYPYISEGTASVAATLGPDRQHQVLTELQHQHFQDLQFLRQQRMFEHQMELNAQRETFREKQLVDKSDPLLGKQAVNYIDRYGRPAKPNIRMSKALDDGFRQVHPDTARNAPSAQVVYEGLDRGMELVKKIYKPVGVWNRVTQYADITHRRVRGDKDIKDLTSLNARLLPLITRLIEQLPGGRLGFKVMGIEQPQLPEDSDSLESATLKLQILKDAMLTTSGIEPLPEELKKRQATKSQLPTLSKPKRTYNPATGQFE